MRLISTSYIVGVLCSASFGNTSYCRKLLSLSALSRTDWKQKLHLAFEYSQLACVIQKLPAAAMSTWNQLEEDIQFRIVQA